MKTVTIGKLVKASKKNGFEWNGNAGNKSAYGRLPGGMSMLSCVVGQGLIHLGGTRFPFMFPSNVDTEVAGQNLSEVFEAIYNYNDREATSYEDAFAFMEKALAPYKDLPIKINVKKSYTLT